MTASFKMNNFLVHDSKKNKPRLLFAGTMRTFHPGDTVWITQYSFSSSGRSVHVDQPPLLVTFKYNQKTLSDGRTRYECWFECVDGERFSGWSLSRYKLYDPKDHHMAVDYYEAFVDSRFELLFTELDRFDKALRKQIAFNPHLINKYKEFYHEKLRSLEN